MKSKLAWDDQKAIEANWAEAQERLKHPSRYDKRSDAAKKRAMRRYMRIVGEEAAAALFRDPTFNIFANVIAMEDENIPYFECLKFATLVFTRYEELRQKYEIPLNS